MLIAKWWCFDRATERFMELQCLFMRVCICECVCLFIFQLGTSNGQNSVTKRAKLRYLNPEFLFKGLVFFFLDLRVGLN